MNRPSPLHQLLAGRGACFEHRSEGEQAVHFGAVADEYRALRESAGLVDLSQRTKIELTGGDRVRFLHNLCTSDIMTMQPGEGCETFITSAQAKVIGHVFVFSCESSLVLETVGGQADRLLGHFNKYVIADDVQLADRTYDWGAVLLAGPGAARLLSGLLAGQEDSLEQIAGKPLAHMRSRIGGCTCWLRRLDLIGAAGYEVVLTQSEAAGCAEALLCAGAIPVGAEAFETARLEAGTPLYGKDITEANLPQEVGRNQQAISFTKGCYLGQETVARIDSYGHVNRILVGLRIEAATVPRAGVELVRDGQGAGYITSSARSPRFGTIALGYVKRGSSSPGTVLDLRGDGAVSGQAAVCALPFSEPE